ncbi:MAG: DUF1580 domain-containing protein [Pirellula sp.]
MSASDCVHRLLTEDVVSLKEAQRELERVMHTKLDRSTIHRWTLRGVKSVKLDSVRFGGKVVTSKQAINRFLVELTEKSAR